MHILTVFTDGLYYSEHTSTHAHGADLKVLCAPK